MKSSLLFCIFCLYFFPVFSQQVVEGHYGKQNIDVAYSAAATNDGGYIITGLTKSMVDSNGDIVVIKINPHGDTAWSHTYGGPLLEGGNFVMQIADGSYIVSGHTQDFGAQDCDAYLMKLDQNGTFQWIKTYGGDSDDVSFSVADLHGGGYVIGGMTRSYGYGNPGSGDHQHIYFIKTNNTGDTVWTKMYAGTGHEECYSIVSMADGGFLAVGYTTSRGNPEQDGWLLRLDANGDTLWTRIYSYAGGANFSKILPTMDNGYIMAGNMANVAGDLNKGIAVKLDANGNEQWRKTYSDDTANIIFRDVVQLPTGNFIFTGINYVTPTTGYVYMMTTDVNGVMMNDELCGGINSYAYAIATQGNNSFLIAGGAAKYGDPNSDLYYWEMDNTNAHVSPVTNTWPRLYPNPVRDQPAIIILPASEANQSVNFEIMAVNGQVIFNKSNILAKDIVIDRKNFAPAQYLFRVTCKDGNVFKGKFVVE